MRQAGLCLAALLLVLTSALHARAQVIVDGDLSDIAAVAQGAQSDPFNEICLLAKSGFDLRWVHVYYDEATDTLFFGLDLMDVPDPDFAGAVGRDGPGVPGDADGNEDPHTADEPACPIEEEQTGVGPDELYLVKVDTNANGDFNEPEDIRILYRGDMLRFEQGDSTPLFGVTGEVVVGTAGAPVDPLLPNQNRNTEDIEIAVHDWSTLDPVPTCFIVTTFSGSLVDGFPEDELITPIVIQVADPSVDLQKDVRNVTAGGDFADAASVEIGDVVEFRLILDNTGNVPLAPVAIEDLLPADLEFIDGSVVGANVVVREPDPEGERITFKQLEGSNTIPQGDDREVTFQATVLDTISGVVVNSADGGGIAPDECAAQDAVDSDDATVSVVDLQCTKEVSLDGIAFSGSVSAAQGQSVTFRVTVENPSAVDLENTTISDTLPVGLENIDAPGCVVVGQTVTCDLGVLPAMSAVSVDITADVASTAVGMLVNTADCTATFGAELLETSCEAEVEVLIPDLICDKNVSPDGVNWSDSLDVVTGMDVFFQVIVTNTGSASFFEVTVDDTLPAGLGNIQVVNGASCGVAGQTVSCSNVGPLDPAGTVTVVYSATVTATNPPDMTLVNTAVCEGISGTQDNPGDMKQTQCDATLNLIESCIVCVKEVSKDGVNFDTSVDALPGDHLFFRVTVSNCGVAELTDLSVVDPVPAGLINVVTADPNCGVAGGTVTCNLPSLLAGLDWQVTYEADVGPQQVDTIVNTATIAGTPTVNGNTGAPLGGECSAEIRLGPLTIPTLSEWGWILLCSMLALTLILHHRFRIL